MKDWVHFVYIFLQKIPDNLFPGGATAYAQRVVDCKLSKGLEYFCTDLFWWHEAFHLAGGLTVMLVYVVGRKSIIVRSVCALVVVYLLVQEFVIHPLLFGQEFWKTLIDLFFWLAPLTVFERKRLWGLVERLTDAHYYFFKRLVLDHAVFVRANIVSLVSGGIDFIVFGILTLLFYVATPYAVVISMLAGAIVYLVFADRWASRTRLKGVGLIHESERFILVWIGCVCLNYLGTVALAHYMLPSAARIVTSFVVGFCWSFPLFNYYVFTRASRAGSDTR